MEELRQVALEAINSVDARYSTDWSAIKGAVKGDLSNYLYKKTKRSPMIPACYYGGLSRSTRRLGPFRPVFPCVSPPEAEGISGRRVN